MKFFAAVAGLCYQILSTHASEAIVPDKFHATKDFIGNTMWAFGSDGIFIYSPDGEELKSTIETTGICGPREEHVGHARLYCSFNDVVSDGKKYVWAAVRRSKPMIDIFDIDTGYVIGSFETCNEPQDIEYHSLRDEVWVRCADAQEGVGETTNLDVFSASNPSGEVQADILLTDRALEQGITSHGSSVIHDTLGDVGYLTDDAIPKLFKLDLSTKNITGTIDEFPNAHGLDTAVYSPANKHIYIVSKICCSCGFEGAQLETCNSDDEPGKQVLISTGPDEGQTKEGVCGRSCEGDKDIDTIGLYEFDTVSEKVIATHLMKEGFGGYPIVSPDGNFVVLLGKNGGKTIRIIQAKEQGLQSRVYIDLELDFYSEDYEGKSITRYVTFFDKDDMSYLVVPSGTSNHVAIIELPMNKFVDNDSIKIDYVTLTDAAFENGAPHGMYRRVMWAQGTDYVWVSDSNDMLFIVDILKKQTVKTLTGFSTKALLSVRNLERASQIDMQNSISSLKSLDMKNEIMAEVSGMMDDNKTSAKSGSGTETAAIIIGCVAFIACVINLAYMQKMKKEFQASLKEGEGKKFIETKREVDVEVASNASSVIPVN